MTGTRRKVRLIIAKELRVPFHEPFEVQRRVRVIHRRLLLDRLDCRQRGEPLPVVDVLSVVFINQFPRIVITISLIVKCARKNNVNRARIIPS